MKLNFRKSISWFFPGNGIHGSGHSREGVKSYLEYIPDPDKEHWNPCQEPDHFNDTEIQRALSCMAKENHLYIVVNMENYQSYNKIVDSKCPKDGQYQLNTNEFSMQMVYL